MITYIYIIVALFISWIWIDYFRLTSIYKTSSLKYIILCFIIGGAAIPITHFIHDNLIESNNWDLNNTLLNDLLFSIFGVGMVEECSKLIAFFIFYFLFKRLFKEPIDYILYSATIALSFAAIENVMYFKIYGAELITGRSLLSAVSHMFDTTFIVYGFILIKFNKQVTNKGITLVLFFLLGVISHGIYDFWLLHENFSKFGWFITLLYYLIMISLFSTIVNNALNNMSSFSYKKSVNPNLVSQRLFVYYAVVFVFQFFILSFEESPEYALHVALYNVISNFAILLILIIRLSRFELIEKKWKNIKLELPFFLKPSNSLVGFTIVIKGDGFNETVLNNMLEEWVYIIPLSRYNSKLKKGRLSFIEAKIFIKKEGYFISSIFEGTKDGDHDKYLIQSKKFGKSFIDEHYPIVGIYQPFTNTKGNKEYKFIEWAFVKEANSKK